jgi:hypothetical protein
MAILANTSSAIAALTAKKKATQAGAAPAPAPSVATGLEPSTSPTLETSPGIQMYTGPQAYSSAAPAAQTSGQYATPGGRTVAPVAPPSDLKSPADFQAWAKANGPGLQNDSNQKAATAQGYGSAVYQTGLYDPTDANQEYNIEGTGALNANGGMNLANFNQADYQDLLDSKKQSDTAVGQAATSRTAAQTSYAAKPTVGTAPTVAGALAPYQSTAPGAYQASAAPQFNVNPQGTDDVVQAAQQYGVQLGNPSGPTAPVGAQDVAGGGAAFSQYATGAQNNFLTALQTQMGQLTDNAAAHNRLKTGFLTQDQGNLGKAVASSFDNDMLTHALDAASLDQQAATGNADRQLTADTGNATRGQQGQQFALSFAGDQAAREDQNALADNTEGYNQYADTRNYGEADQQQQYSQYADQRNSALTAEGQDYDQFANTRDAAQNTYASDRDFTQGVATTDQNEADAQRSFYTNLLQQTQGNYTQQAADQAANSGFAGFIKNTVAPIAGIAGDVAGIISPAAGATKAVKKVAGAASSGLAGANVNA